MTSARRSPITLRGAKLAGGLLLLHGDGPVPEAGAVSH